jgi:hypothetical protein
MASQKKRILTYKINDTGFSKKRYYKAAPLKMTVQRQRITEALASQGITFGPNVDLDKLK